MRLALSAHAAGTLVEARVRRLLAFELDGHATLSTQLTGPLGDEVALIWVDLPDDRTATVQVRLGSRPAVRRAIVVAGLVPDVSARLIAIAAAEAVRDLTRPVHVHRPAPARGPTPAEREIASRGWPAVAVDASLGGAALPSAGGWLGGPGLELSLRDSNASLALGAQYLGGATTAGPLRWLDVSVGAGYRIWLGPSTRLQLGALASAASIHLGEGVEDRDTWSARASGRVGIELGVGRSTWVGLALEPGAILRPVPYAAQGAAQQIGGPFIGAKLSLLWEHRHAH